MQSILYGIGLMTKKKNPVEARKCEEKFSQVGAEIVYLPHTEGISSTLLRQKLEEKESH